MSADKDALNAMRGVGMSAADIVKRSNQGSQQMSRSLGYIHAINGDGTMDVNVATLTDPQVLYGVRAMDSCSGSSVGDRVVLDTLNYRTYAVGTLARTDDKFVTRGEFDEVRDSVSHDYIVAQGTSGIWFYRKWNSGLAEFWGGKELSGTGSFNAPAINFPFRLTNLLYKSASAIYSSGSKGVYILSGSGASISLVDTGVYKINQDIKDNSTTTVAFIQYNVKGLWK